MESKKSAVNENYKYSEITGEVIKHSMKIHSELGCGYPEVIYQRALALELKRNNIHYGREVEMPVFYDGMEIGFRRVDFLIENKVLVELKAIGEVNNAHYNQILNYLKAYKKEVGLLINFGEESLRFKRFIFNENYNQRNHNQRNQSNQ